MSVNVKIEDVEWKVQIFLEEVKGVRFLRQLKFTPLDLYVEKLLYHVDSYIILSNILFAFCSKIRRIISSAFFSSVILKTFKSHSSHSKVSQQSVKSWLTVRC